MKNELRIYPFIKELQYKLKHNDYVVDKSGVKLVEILNARILHLNPLQPTLEFVGKKTNTKYVEKEKAWYLSQNLSIINYVDDVTIWNSCASKDAKKEVNSNYGYLVYSKKNGNQFENVVNTLKNHKESRQAVIIYNRPSIHHDWNERGKRDFICTFYQHFFIRDNKLICLTNMRSNDLIFGTCNDLPWFFYVYNDVYSKLKEFYPELQVGHMDFTANSLHVYERHFETLKKIKLNRIDSIKYMFNKIIR